MTRFILYIFFIASINCFGQKNKTEEEYISIKQNFNFSTADSLTKLLIYQLKFDEAIDLIDSLLKCKFNPLTPKLAFLRNDVYFEKKFSQGNYDDAIAMYNDYYFLNDTIHRKRIKRIIDAYVIMYGKEKVKDEFKNAVKSMIVKVNNENTDYVVTINLFNKEKLFTSMYLMRISDKSIKREKDNYFRKRFKKSMICTLTQKL